VCIIIIIIIIITPVCHFVKCSLTYHKSLIHVYVATVCTLVIIIIIHISILP